MEIDDFLEKDTFMNQSSEGVFRYFILVKKLRVVRWWVVGEEIGQKKGGLSLIGVIWGNAK